MGNGRETGRARGARLGRWLGFLLLVASLAAAPAPSGAGGLRPLDRHAVVLNGSTVGSAFAIGEGVAVTNRHVVEGLLPGGRVRLLASGPGGGTATGRLIAVSQRMDLAVLAVPPGLLPAVPAEPGAVAAGDRVLAAGVDASNGPDGPRYAAAGEVIAVSAEIAAFGPGLIVRLPRGKPGFSGGPLFDARGRLVGMVTALRGGSGPVPLAGSGVAGGSAPGVEAYALRAAAVRQEVARLIGGFHAGR